MPSLTLLGDSIFDNQAYTKGQPDVSAHLRARLPEDWRVTLCAIDGTTTSSLGRQLDRVPDHSTHLVLSLGGNDALENADLLDSPTRSTGEALDLFEGRVSSFRQSYGWALDAVLELGLPTTVCTIYNGNLPGDEGRRARVALMMFNDVIVEAALSRGVNMIELRAVCTEVQDYANPIEPSGSGGEKIAAAIARGLGVEAEALSAVISA